MMVDRGEINIINNKFPNLQFFRLKSNGIFFSSNERIAFNFDRNKARFLPENFVRNREVDLQIKKNSLRHMFSGEMICKQDYRQYVRH